MKVIFRERRLQRGMTGCECGICNHFSEEECMRRECKCCVNFHSRSGPLGGRAPAAPARAGRGHP